MSTFADIHPPPDSAAPPLLALSVDDMALNLRVSELLLKRLGCQVVVAENVATALAQLRAQEFDLVLTDIEMPDIDGLEAVALFRTTAEQAHPNRKRPIKVFAVSAGRFGMVRDDYLTIGFDDYLEKPIELEKLRGILQCCRPQGG